MRRLRRAFELLEFEKQEREPYRGLPPQAQVKEDGGFDLDASTKQQGGK